MIVALAVFSLLALALHLISIVLAARRVRLRRPAVPVPAGAPPVTLIRPVCGTIHSSSLSVRAALPKSGAGRRGGRGSGA